MSTVGTGALIEVKLDTLFSGITMLNVWYYFNASSGSPNYANWHGQFSADMVGKINSVQAAAVDMPSMSVVNLNSTDVPYVADPGFGAGPLLGQSIPPFLAAAFRLNRSTTVTRNGYKRLYVGTEDEMDGGVWTAAFLTLLEPIRLQMFDTITVDGVVWDPVIVRKLTPGTTTPVLPVPQWSYNIINGSKLDNRVRHQVSRE